MFNLKLNDVEELTLRHALMQRRRKTALQSRRSRRNNYAEGSVFWRDENRESRVLYRRIRDESLA